MPCKASLSRGSLAAAHFESYVLHPVDEAGSAYKTLNGKVSGAFKILNVFPIYNFSLQILLGYFKICYTFISLAYRNTNYIKNRGKKMSSLAAHFILG